MVIFLQQSHFLHKVNSNTLPCEPMILGSNKIVKKKNFIMIKL